MKRYDIYKVSGKNIRFKLGKSGNNKLIVLSLNPSTATDEKADVTVSKVERISLLNSFDGFVLVNLYPLRKTSPSKLPKWKNKNIYYENLSLIINFISKEEGPVIWAAWGKDISLRTYLRESLKLIHKSVEKFQTEWIHFGSLTKDGHPRHPSRVSYRWNFSGFDIENYVATL